MEEVITYLHRLVKGASRAQLEEFFSSDSFPAYPAESVDDAAVDSAEIMRMRVGYVIDKRNNLKYTPLQSAIFARNVDAVELFIELGADINLKCHGTPILHLVISIVALVDGKEFGLTCLNLLLKHSTIDTTAKDDQGATALHVAAEFNLVEALQLLLNHTGESCIDVKDRIGMKPIHRAAFRDSSEAVKMLLDHGANLTSQTLFGLTPLHVAAYSSAVASWNVLVQKPETALNSLDKWGRTPAQVVELVGYSLSKSNQMVDKVATQMATTAIVTHPMCRRHYTCPPSETESDSAPPENIKRLAVIIDETNGVLRGSDLGPRLKWVEEARPATISDVLRVHEWSYIRNIQSKCESIGTDPEKASGMDSLDGDTTISRHTFDAALHGAGAVCHAVDLLVKGDARNAFCPVRPPGHHAGPRGLVKGKDGGPDSHGFCFLNNISIGAAYALNVHREHVKRVAIVDFDVHHGNGTEETVRWLKPGVFEMDLLNPTCFGSLNIPQYKPWFDKNDANNVLFVSVHGYGPRERGLEYLMPQAAFYPGSGKTVLPQVATRRNSITDLNKHNQNVPGEKVVAKQVADDNEEQDDEDDHDDDDDDDDDDEDDDYVMDDDDAPARGTGVSANDRVAELKAMYSSLDNNSSEESMPPLILDIGVNLPMSDDAMLYRHQWKNYFRAEIFTRLMKFKPDMIFISAGFDAHKKDTINGGYISLVEEDFDWVTSNLVKVANTCCNGRIVSALEGGYQLGGEYCSAFAKSVKTHVVALERGAKSSHIYSEEEASQEMQIEKDIIDELEKRRLLKLEAAQKRQEALYAAALEQREAAERAGGEAEPTVEGSAKKRRRAAVDYVALEQELLRKKEAQSE